MITELGVFGSGLIAALILSISLPGSAFAQTTVSSSAAVTSSGIARASCVAPSPALYRGLTNARVTTLQQSLATLGYFHVSATGYFGPITYGSVVAFQRANGVPATGYFGPLSYAAMTRACGTMPPPAKVSFSATPTAGAAPLTATFTADGLSLGSEYIIEYGDGSTSGSLLPGTNNQLIVPHTYTANGTYTAILEPYVACMWNNPRCMIATMPLGTITITVGDATTAAPRIISIEPASGSVGTQVTITGNNFTNDNTIHFGGGVIMHVPISSTTDIQCFAAPCYPIQTLKFAVLGALSPACRFSTPVCGMLTQMTTPGAYPVYVENVNGSSNQTTFTVTSQN